MKVALVTYSCTDVLWGGTEMFVYQLVRGLLSRGNEVVVYLPPGAFANTLHTLGVNAVVVEMDDAVRSSRYLRRAIRDGGFDLLHAVRIYPAFLTCSAIPDPVLPVVCTLVGDYSPELWDEDERAIFQRSLPTVIRRADVITMNNQAQLATYSPFGYDLSTVQVVRPLRDDSYRNWERPVDLPRDLVLIGFHGSLSREKGPFVIIEAVRLLKRRIGSIFQLVVLGDGIARNAMEEAARLAGIDDVITFAGSVAEPHAYLAYLDFYVYPCLMETFGFAVMEALDYDLPVVSTNQGVIPEVLDSSFGTLVPPGDSVALAEAMCEMTCNQEFRRTVVDRIRRNRRRDDLNVFLDSYIGIYQNAISAVKPL